MKITFEIDCFKIHVTGLLRAIPALCLLIVLASATALAQQTVALPRIVLEPRHTQYVSPPNTTPTIIRVKSNNPGVATARAYANDDQVQIVGVGPGRTTVEFFDDAAKVLYTVPVWVEAPNATGGGGSGYDPANKIQLEQIVMAVKRTQNVGVPGSPSPRISGVRSSNPSVATARTDPPSGIQIYAVALGDTFIEFTDNVTGNVFQVHVWVRNAADLPPASPGPEPGSGPTPRPKPKASSSPNQPRVPRTTVPYVNAKVDRCMIGTWRSQPMSDPGFTVNAGVYREGGLAFTVSADGSASFSYDGTHSMTGEAFGGVSSTTTIRGSVTARIATDLRNHMLTTETEPVSAATVTVRGPDENRSSRFYDFLPFGGQVVEYVCAPSGLTLKFSQGAMQFTKAN